MGEVTHGEEEAYRTPWRAVPRPTRLPAPGRAGQPLLTHSFVGYGDPTRSAPVNATGVHPHARQELSELQGTPSTRPGPPQDKPVAL